MPGEVVDAAAAPSLPALLPAPASIPTEAVADSPVEPPVAVDVGMAEAPPPLVIPDPPFSTMRRGRSSLSRSVSGGLTP
jgi:hypothetical protein